MPLNEIPAFFHPEIRSLIDSTLGCEPNHIIALI